VLHTDAAGGEWSNGGDNGLDRWWFDNITSRGVPFDVIASPTTVTCTVLSAICSET
jgi:hypothetical protein